MRNILYLSAFLILTQCTSHDEPELIYEVSEEFQPIVEQFILEAGNRGFQYEINNLILRYDDELDPKFCCESNVISSNPNEQKIILINSTICWVNDFQKEALIFHELGHCFLGRYHDESLLPNNDPKSMMVKDDISVYSPCVYAFGDDDCNFTFKRTYYLDELFNEDTAIPDWAN